MFPSRLLTMSFFEIIKINNPNTSNLLGLIRIGTVEGDLHLQLLVHHLVGVGKNTNLQVALLLAQCSDKHSMSKQGLFSQCKDSSVFSFQSTVVFFGNLTKRWGLASGPGSAAS